MTDHEALDRGIPPWRLAVALAVVAALATGLVLVARAEETPGSQASVARERADSPTSSVATTGRGEGKARVLAGTEAALEAWGWFAATGEIAAVDDAFWPEGPQRSQLAAEAPTIRASPLGAPAYEFTLSGAAVVTVSGDVAEVTGTVTVSRPGTETAAYDWTLEMRWDPEMERWRLWTVRPGGD